MLGAVWMVLLAGVLAVPGALAADGAGKKKTGQSAVDIILRLTRAGYPASWENVRRVIEGDLVLPSERKTSSSTSGGKTAGSGADTRSRKPAQKAKPSNTKRNATSSRPASEPRMKLGRTRERRNRDSGWKSYYVVIWGARDSIRPGSLYPERSQTPVAKRRRVDQYLLFEQTRVRRPGKSRWHACHNVKAGLTVDEYRVKRSSFQRHRQRLKRHLERTGGIRGEVVFAGKLAAKKRARRLANDLRRKRGDRYSVMSVANKPSLPPRCGTFLKRRLTR
ncbi:hypothetical protein [Stappia sp.]|uniref:hypothetical protein n=1 Tax=Stappia sp. TaxID=1870903 RepID=UPI003A99D622